MGFRPMDAGTTLHELPRNEPLILGFQQNDEAAAVSATCYRGLVARAGRDAGSGPRNIGEAESCSERRNTAMVIGAAPCAQPLC